MKLNLVAYENLKRKYWLENEEKMKRKYNGVRRRRRKLYSMKKASIMKWRRRENMAAEEENLPL